MRSSAGSTPSPPRATSSQRLAGSAATRSRQAPASAQPGAAAAPSAAPADGDNVERTYLVEVSGRRFGVKVIGAAGGPAATPEGRPAPRRGERKAHARDHADELHSPLQGNVWKLPV